MDEKIYQGKKYWLRSRSWRGILTSKTLLKIKNFKISDLAMYDHLDFKNVDAQKTQFESNYYDFVIAVNMIHHVPYPIKFLNEMHRIL